MQQDDLQRSLTERTDAVRCGFVLGCLPMTNGVEIRNKVGSRNLCVESSEFNPR